MQVSIEVTVGELEELVTDIDHDLSNHTSDLEVLAIPGIEVLIGFVYKQNFFFGESLFIFWFWCIEFVPQLFVSKVKIPIRKHSYAWDDKHIELTLEEGQDELCIDSNTIENTNYSIEGYHFSMETKYILGAEFSSN
jgi:hypothetical protein